MKRILKNEVGRCRYCGSSVVVFPFYVGRGATRHLAHGGCCANKECGCRTAGADTPEKAIALIRSWGILQGPCQEKID